MKRQLLRLSNSEMVTWRRCKRKWYFSVYRRLAPRTDYPPGSAISVGNLVHDALAAYYGDKRQDPLAYAKAKLEAACKVRPFDEHDLRKEFTLCEAMISGYVEWLSESGADADLIFRGSERVAEVQMVEGIHLISKLDAPVDRVSDGAKLAIEHKTVSSLDQHLPTLRTNTQFLTEHLTRFMDSQEKGATPEEAIQDCQGVLINMLRKVKRTASAKPPFYDRIDVTHNIYELRNHWHHVLTWAREIQDAETRLDAGESHQKVAPPNSTHDCHWDCPFYRVCPMADDGSDLEGALAGMYSERDPLERYLNAEDL